MCVSFTWLLQDYWGCRGKQSWAWGNLRPKTFKTTRKQLCPQQGSVPPQSKGPQLTRPSLCVPKPFSTSHLWALRVSRTSQHAWGMQSAVSEVLAAEGAQLGPRVRAVLIWDQGHLLRPGPLTRGSFHPVAGPKGCVLPGDARRPLLGPSVQCNGKIHTYLSMNVHWLSPV